MLRIFVQVWIRLSEPISVVLLSGHDAANGAHPGVMPVGLWSRVYSSMLSGSFWCFLAHSVFSMQYFNFCAAIASAGRSGSPSLLNWSVEALNPTANFLYNIVYTYTYCICIYIYIFVAHHLDLCADVFSKMKMIVLSCQPCRILRYPCVRSQRTGCGAWSRTYPCSSCINPDHCTLYRFARHILATHCMMLVLPCHPLSQTLQTALYSCSKAYKVQPPSPSYWQVAFFVPPEHAHSPFCVHVIWHSLCANRFGNLGKKETKYI